MRYLIGALFLFCLSAGTTTDIVRTTDETVMDIDPRWPSRQVAGSGKKYAILSLCGAELESCANAKARLRYTTSVCSNIFLGVVDLDRHPRTPRDLYGTRNPQFIVLRYIARRMPRLAFLPFSLEPDPDVIGKRFCREEWFAQSGVQQTNE